jgi:hypothetical protein
MKSHINEFETLLYLELNLCNTSHIIWEVSYTQDVQYNFQIQCPQVKC